MFQSVPERVQPPGLPLLLALICKVGGCQGTGSSELDGCISHAGIPGVVSDYSQLKGGA